MPQGRCAGCGQFSTLTAHGAKRLCRKCVDKLIAAAGKLGKAGKGKG